MTSVRRVRMHLPDLIGKGYGEFWRSRKTYVVCKGSRASKKSKTAAMWHVNKIMQYPLANALIVRKVERTMRDSTFADIQWAIKKQNVEHLWKVTTSPLEAVYIPTGQKIMFRGMDDPLKLASVSVATGVLCWLWVEEAYEILSESDFDTLDESIRGQLPEGYFKRVTITLNPWNEHHWIKRRFFDEAHDDVLSMTTNYMCNEWLSDSDLKLFENMRLRNPRRYRVAGLGEWGIVDGLVYENWHEEAFDPQSEEFLNAHPNLKSAFGLDFGYTNDPSALFCGLVDTDGKQLFVVDEMYERGMSNRRIFERIQSMGYAKERITADSAEPKSIDELKGYGLHVKPAVKGKDSIANGIQWIQDFEIIVHPRCVNFLTEIGNYTWDEDRFGNRTNKPIDDFNHLMDAMRYGLERHMRKSGWIY